MGALGIGLSLALRQRAGVRGFDFTGGALPPGASLTRALAATRWTAGGGMESVGADVPRFDHHPVTLVPRGILIEGAQTNVLLRSGELGSAPWTAPGASLTGGQASPDGGSGATLASDGGASFGQVAQTIAATGGTMCLSAHVRKDAVGRASRFVVLRLGSNIDLGLDTATGDVADLRGVGTSHGVEDCGAWWRAWIATTASISTATIYPAWGAGPLLTSSLNAAATGSATLFGLQLEARASPSSYVPSGAVAGSRAADVLTLNWAMLGVGDGARTVRYGFDDGSAQDVTTMIAGGVAVVPTDLSRRRIVSARVV